MPLNLDEALRNVLETTVEHQLRWLGEDPTREGLVETPKRVVKAWETLYGGYNIDPASLFTVFDARDYDQMVVLTNIQFFSTCEHHLLPFFGKAHVAYIPDRKVVGVSKLARLVDMFARRMQIQERIGTQVTSALMKYLHPLGAACVIEAEHICMRARGVQQQSSFRVTSSLQGVFKEKADTRAEFLDLIKRG